MSKHKAQFLNLSDVGTIGRGKSKHRPRNDPSLYNGKYPFIQTGDVKSSNFYITDYSQTYNERGLAQSKLWNPGTLCITIAANIADTVILKIHACFPDSIIGFIPDNNKSDIRFIKYCLDTYKLQIRSISQGTTQDNLSLEKLLSIKLKIPSLPIQKKIAAILSTYDDLIENNDRRITLLEKMAEEIYREWFVRLRFPGHEQATFHKGIPDGWEIKELEEFCKRVTDGTHDTPKPTNEGYFLVTGKNIKNGTVDFESAYKISKKDHINISKRSGLQAGDIIFSNIGTLGSIAIVTDDVEYSVKNVLIFKPVDENQSVFLYYMLKEKYVLENLLLHSSGASQQFIGLTIARKFKVFDPGKLLINTFGEFVLPLQQKRLLLIRANSKLKQTRDRLLTRLISGKLSVEDLDIQFPPSMTESVDTERQ
jgi:type I restriction enzyme, S subunit